MVILASLSPLRLFVGRKDDNYKGKISVALREIETHRKELETLKSRLGERRQKLFDFTVRALQEKNKSRASVYANEHTELRKVIKVVEASELALMQVTLRLQSITDIGDAMAHMNGAFKTMKEISRTVQGLVPALDAASQEINNTLTETMAEMGQLTPSMTIDVRTEKSEELVEQARKFAEEQAEELKRTLDLVPGKFEEEVSRINTSPLLATGDGKEEEEENAILGVMYSSPRDASVENEVLKYAFSHNGTVDVVQASSVLGIPSDEVEHSMLKLIAEGKVRLTRSSE